MRSINFDRLKQGSPDKPAGPPRPRPPAANNLAPTAPGAAVTSAPPTPPLGPPSSFVK
jgi:hypothetical protein